MTAETKYPELFQLMGGWFHQDYSIEGDTLEEVMAAYLEVATPAIRRALVDDIRRFLQDAKDVEADFQEVFQPDIIPTGFAPTTRAFLERIAELTKVQDDRP